MARLMPELEAFFHYRNLDVSTLKELATTVEARDYRRVCQAGGSPGAG